MRALALYATTWATEPPYDPAPRDRAPRSNRPSVLRRWAKKLRSAVPASFRVFHRVLGAPVPATRPKVGSHVVARGGEPIGPVQDVLIGLGSGNTVYAIRDERGEDARMLLVPTHALSAGDGHSVLRDEKYSSPIRPELVHSAA